MRTATRTAIYAGIIFLVVFYDSEYPYGLWWKRTKHLVTWKIAAMAQRQATNAYSSYIKYVEVNHG